MAKGGGKGGGIGTDIETKGGEGERGDGEKGGFFLAVRYPAAADLLGQTDRRRLVWVGECLFPPLPTSIREIEETRGWNSLTLVSSVIKERWHFLTIS